MRNVFLVVYEILFYFSFLNLGIPLWRHVLSAKGVCELVIAANNTVAG